MGFIRDADSLHEGLLTLGDMTLDELAAPCEAKGARNESLERWLDELQQARRIFPRQRGGETRFAAAEDASRFRDALGVVIPPGLPAVFLEAVADPLADLVSRFARTHVAFHEEDAAERLGISIVQVRSTLERLAAQDRVVEGEFLPGGRGGEWCDAGVLRTLKRRSLALLRKQIEPAETHVWGNFLVRWHGLDRPRRGLDGLLDAIEILQGTALPVTDLERMILPARVKGFEPNDLDELCAAGEIVWQGRDSLGTAGGKISLSLTDHLPLLVPRSEAVTDPLELQILNLLTERGALFFDNLHAEIGGFRHDLRDGLWRLVWTGHVTNDTLAPLRSLMREGLPPRSRRRASSFRSRRTALLPGTEGRWT
jgi:ATP-dependent Lhr-like helicase